MPEPAPSPPAGAASLGVAGVMLIAMTMFSLMGPFIRMASEELHVFVVAFWRNALAVALLAPIALRGRGFSALKTTHLDLHLLRGALGAVAMAASFSAVTLIPLAKTAALGFTAPMFATLLAVLVLRERIRAYRMTALGAGFVGVVVVAWPSISGGAAAEDGLGVGLALLAALLIAVIALLVRKLALDETPAAISLWMVLLQAPISFVAALFFWDWPSLETFGWLLALAVAGTIGQVAIARAASMAEVTQMQPYEFAKLPLAALFGYAVFSETPASGIWVGGALIFLATAFITHREAQLGRVRRPEKRIIQ